MDKIDKHCYFELLTWWMVLRENICYQHKGGLIDRTIYAGWNRDL